MSVSLLVVPGSTRKAAFSKQLARAAVAAAEGLGAKPTLVDLADYAMPLYDGDLEDREGVPEGAVRLRERIVAHDALLFVSPEYNASVPAVFKNTIDWLSRPDARSKQRAFRGQVAGLLSSSPGALGGLRGLVHLRQILMNVGLLVPTEQFALSAANQAFDDQGALKDERQQAGVAKVITAVVRLTRALASTDHS